MTERSRNDERLNALVAELLDGGFSAPLVQELRALLQHDDAARQLYFEQLVTHAMLQWRHGITGDLNGQTASDDRPMTKERLLPTATDGEAMKQSKPPAKAPPVLGFLGSVTNASAFFPVIFVLSLMVLSAVAYVALVFRSEHGNQPPFVAEDSTKAIDSPAASGKSAAAMVAKLTAASHCTWSAPNPSLQVSDSVCVGQSLRLASGAAEITFGIGARVILQSPTSLTIDSPKSIRLNSGKLTAEITSVDARGFKVLTPDATFVDQGTEFGVEVAPSGSSRIHVFKGEVDLALGNKTGLAVPTHRLLTNSGARLEGNAPNVTFVQDTGESFLRSMDETERDLHVVAYWRFEDHPVGTLLPDTKKNTEVTCATVDSSFNSNDLYTYFTQTRPAFSEDVAAAVVPSSGRANRTCLDNTENPGPASTRDLYTSSSFSHSYPIDIQQITPAQWTIEASVKVVELGRTQTFVGRDGAADVHANVPPPLAFQITSDGQLAIRFIDVEHRAHETIANDFVVQPGSWYHVAAQSDGKEVRLFANSLDGRGYRLLATTALPREGSTALSTGSPEAIWAIGRGKAHTGWPGQWFKGWIDEVRITDIALEPSAMLFAEKKSTEVMVSDAQPVTEIESETVGRGE